MLSPCGTRDRTPRMSRRMCRMAVLMQTAPHPRGCTTPYAGMPGHGKHAIPAYIERAEATPVSGRVEVCLRERGMEGTRRERGNVRLCVFYVRNCLISSEDRAEGPHN